MCQVILSPNSCLGLKPVFCKVGPPRFKGEDAMATDNGIWVGIDVSKAKLDVGALPSGNVWTVSNDDSGLD